MCVTWLLLLRKYLTKRQCQSRFVVFESSSSCWLTLLTYRRSFLVAETWRELREWLFFIRTYLFIIVFFHSTPSVVPLSHSRAAEVASSRHVGAQPSAFGRFVCFATLFFESPCNSTLIPRHWVQCWSLNKIERRAPKTKFLLLLLVTSGNAWIWLDWRIDGQNCENIDTVIWREFIWRNFISSTSFRRWWLLRIAKWISSYNSDYFLAQLT